MTVYIDQAEFYKPNGRVGYAHMTADSLEELHEFAREVDIKHCWFHRGSKYPHYDVSSQKRDAAVAAGAVVISSKELAQVAKLLYEKT